MKRIISAILLTAIVMTSFAGCKPKDEGSSGSSQGSSQENTQESSQEDTQGSFDTSQEITVVSREDGSGTRGAFIELFGIQEKGEDGTKTDKTTKEAIIANKTDIMLTNISGDDYAIGYVSLGSLSDSVKALKIDDVEATAQNVKDGSYKVARPFVIATKGEADGIKKDFIDFILSKEGQEIVAKSYIAVDDAAAAYAGTKPAGKLVIAGSSSVNPVMEKLKEGYIAINPNAEIQIQQTDSTAGITDAIEGRCDIGMASRDLKESELEQLTGTSIAIDGIAVIVNPNNSVSSMTSEQVKNIFTGSTLTWSL